MRLPSIRQFGLGVLVAMVLPPTSVSGQSEPPVRFSVRVTEEVRFERPISADVMPDGGLVVGTIFDEGITRLGTHGEVLWRVEAESLGVVDFSRIHRVSSAPDGRVLVLDTGSDKFVILSPDGQLIGEGKLPFPFSIIDSILWLPTGKILVSGVTEWGGQAEQHSLHLLNEDFSYSKSLGPLPEVRNRAVLASWGAGGVARCLNGDVLFTLRLPYEVHRYSVELEDVSSFVAPFEIDNTPDDAVILAPGTPTIRNPDGILVPRPVPMLEVLPGLFLGGRVVKREFIWDYFDSDGNLLFTNPAPESWRFPIGVDPASGDLWIWSTAGDSHVFLRVRVERN